MENHRFLAPAIKQILDCGLVEEYLREKRNNVIDFTGESVDAIARSVAQFQSDRNALLQFQSFLEAIVLKSGDQR